MPSGTVTPPSGGASLPIHAASFSLTDAQIKTLPFTAVTIVAAKGANTTIVPLFVFGVINKTAGFYTNIDGAGSGALLFVGTDGGGFPAFGGCTIAMNADITSLTTVLGTSTTKVLFAATQEHGILNFANVASGTEGLGGAVLASALNSDLVIRASNSGNFTGGGVGNSMVGTVLYVTANATTGALA